MLYDHERWHYEDEFSADGYAHTHTRACWFSLVLYDRARWYEDDFNADGYAHAREPFGFDYDHDRWHYEDEASADAYAHAHEPVGFDSCSTITGAGILKMSSPSFDH